MLQLKLEITEKIIQLISDTRKSKGITANDLSISLGKPKYWLTNIEAKKTKFIAKEDLIKTICELLKKTPNEAESYIDDYLENPQTSDEPKLFRIDEDKDINYKEEIKKHIKGINEGFEIINKSSIPEKDRADIFSLFNRNMHAELGFMLSLVSLPWFLLKDLDDESKSKLFKEIFEIIKANKSRKKEDNQAPDTEE